MAIRTEPFVINMGPVHPSTHGVYRMRLTVDGEVIVDIEPVIGYLHRGIEKIAEERTWTGVIPLTDRLDYMSSMTNNLAYCMAVEKLAGIVVPERAEYLRVIMSELQRIANHFIAVGSFFNDTGTYYTVFLSMYREREKIIDLFDMACGQRLTYNYMRIGGVSQDVPGEFVPAVNKVLEQLPPMMDLFDTFLKENEILLGRSVGVGILPAELAINSGASGPVLRASGVEWDLRKADPYSVYDRFEFDVPTGSNGDIYDRYRIRIEEIRQSLHILEQAVKQLPEGPVKADVPHILHPPAGEAYAHIEAPKGELGFYVVSDGSIAPYRCHIRSTSLMNLAALKEMVIGWKIADLVSVFGSIDICLGEVDR